MVGGTFRLVRHEVGGARYAEQRRSTLKQQRSLPFVRLAKPVEEPR